ncbi:Peptidoglycan-binding domain 1 [hydrothermal vent metagenome]|uniref:Peptidoglycan-binding domain 1 n=1 Tax=hydrothermal vent metagenome TaxID=652676 RepID=A0A1W1EFW7_9ZZZZ
MSIITKIKAITLAALLSFSFLSASVEDYQKIYKQDQQEFKSQMRQELIKQTADFRGKVKAIYIAIDYQPVWVDKDYLTQHTELLITELKEDFKKGLYKNLVSEYKKLLPDDNQIFLSDSIEDKAKVEIGIMKLYVKVIDNILKDHKSKHTPLSIIQKALAEQDLMSAVSSIDSERVMNEISSSDVNLTKLKENQEKYRKITKRLMGEDKKDRLSAMYELLEYRSIWITEKGLTKNTNDLFEQIENDISLDKNSTTYLKYQELKNADTPKEKEAIGVRELEIANLYQDYMSHLLYGSIDWKKFQKTLRSTMKHGVWRVHDILATPESLLIGAVKDKSLKSVFKRAKPDAAMYDRLLFGLEKYQKIVKNGGWEALPDFKNLKPGMKSSIVPALRERLRIEGDYVCDHNETGTRYKGCIVEAVKRFQGRHGLETKGFVGKMTRKALSQSAESKVAKIKLNIDRVKWLKRGSDQYHIFINIPSFSMYMFDGSDLLTEMRVIIGRKGHETPIFYGRVRTVVLNPYWRIPPSIIRHETVPKLQKDSGYADKKKIEIHTGYSEHSKRINPHKVNWHKYGKKLPPYKFMQSPGEFNALGKVKYLFPNKYSVYMHDTNQKHLFVKDNRALSHGCIRLHKPFDLLEVLSEIEPKINFEKTKEILSENKKTPYRLSATIPVDTIYLTTLVDKDGNVMFYEDVYGYDKLQFDTLIK